MSPFSGVYLIALLSRLLITKVKEAAQARVRANSDRRPDKPEARPRGRGARRHGM